VGYYNTAVGYGALRVTIVGYNTGVGFAALYGNKNGMHNTAVGNNSLFNNIEGQGNVAIGSHALYLNKWENANTAVGTDALYTNTGYGNIALGSAAGYDLTTGDNNIDIGSRGVPGEANTTRIGDVQTRAFMAGIRGVTTAKNDAVNVVITSDGQLGTLSSSRRYKEDIADMGEASARLQSLRPVTFRYKKAYANGEKPIQFGLIAEEVAEVFPELAILNEEGQPETVKYQDLAPLLLNEFLKEHRLVDAQAKTIAEQARAIADEKKTNAEQQDQIRVLAETVAALKARDEARETRLTRLEAALDNHPARAVNAMLDMK
jgi:hypothetical protein